MLVLSALNILEFKSNDQLELPRKVQSPQFRTSSNKRKELKRMMHSLLLYMSEALGSPNRS